MTNEDFLEQLANLVRIHRKKSQLTQNELALLAGVGKTAVFDLEQGKTNVKLNTLLRILDVLNIQLVLQSPLINHLGEFNEKS